MKSVGELNPEPSTTCWIFRYRGLGILTVTLLSRTVVQQGAEEGRDPKGVEKGVLGPLACGRRVRLGASDTPIALQSHSYRTPIILQSEPSGRQMSYPQCNNLSGFCPKCLLFKDLRPSNLSQIRTRCATLGPCHENHAQIAPESTTRTCGCRFSCSL